MKATAPAVQTPKVENDKDSVTTQPAALDQQVISQEERVEYRDEHGNLLDEAQVFSLAAEGKVTLKTKYETKTRIVDKDGNEVAPAEPVAPEHPDVDGQNPDTKGAQDKEGKSVPAEAEVPIAESMSKGIDNKEPKPASEVSEATK